MKEDIFELARRNRMARAYVLGRIQGAEYMLKKIAPEVRERSGDNVLRVDLASSFESLTGLEEIRSVRKDFETFQMVYDGEDFAEVTRGYLRRIIAFFDRQLQELDAAFEAL